MKDRHPRSTTFKIITGAVVVVTVFMLRGLVPELYRYLRIKRM